MTVDTAGTHFDTAIGVYTLEDGQYVQQVCVDDVFEESYLTNIASLSFDTIEAETYYLQVGGMLGNYGHLKVALD